MMMMIHELDTCLYHGEYFICQLFKPILHLENDENFCETNPINKKCKTARSMCTNRWIELHSTSQYMYFCCDTYSIKIICDDQVTVRQLTRAGVIRMNQKCFVKGKDFTLYSLQQQANQIELSPNILVPELDQINHIVSIKLPTEEELPEDTGINSSLSILREQIETLKTTKAEVNDISVHDIHHYTIIYVLLGIAICAVIILIWRRATTCLRSTFRRAEPHHRQESAATTSTSTDNRVYSEVQPRNVTIADRQPNESDYIELGSLLAKRWPSALRSKNRATVPVVRKERAPKIEDSLV
ncbi:hypothetical protein PYW08_013007 [Mythimna loreyi]|uniref:Uncharacterized protein n=1 Tax=Mythimna loreyi TaxID=667449 RepID=A0ACC2Q1J9_9NEOP|nr:hypothetical protein PYW08_013007 [Mythimna loreyi]